jgi:hypothetical protein
MSEHEETEPKIEVYLDCGFRGDRLDPADVTASLHLEPSCAYRAGEVYRGRDGVERMRPSTVWHYTTASAVQSAEPEEHVRYLLDKLEPVADVIRAIRSKADYSCVYIRYEIGYHIASFGMSGKMLARLAALVDDVNFSIITHDEEEEDTNVSEV